jgi:hypothetical protein
MMLVICFVTGKERGFWSGRMLDEACSFLFVSAIYPLRSLHTLARIGPDKHNFLGVL